MFAEGDVLKSIARERGVDDGGSDEEIRSRLFQALGLEEVEVKVDEESNDEKVEYSLQILNSDSLKENNGTVILDGNVSISFSYGDEKPKTLSSSTLILDTENKKERENNKHDNRSNNLFFNAGTSLKSIQCNYPLSQQFFLVHPLQLWCRRRLHLQDQDL